MATSARKTKKAYTILGLHRVDGRRSFFGPDFRPDGSWLHRAIADRLIAKWLGSGSVFKDLPERLLKLATHIFNLFTYEL